MIEREQEVRSLLRKHDYITLVQKKDDGCIIKYPQPKLIFDYPRIITAFSFKRGDNPGLWTTDSYSRGEEKFLSIPEYALRIYMVCDISSCNNSIPISISLVAFLDEAGEEKEDIADIMLPPSSEDGIEKEGFLHRLFIEARNDNFLPEYEKVAETHGVHEGYTLIRKFYN